MESRRGLTLGVAAYAIWGAFPLYFPLLEPAGAIEVLAHRIVWSALTTVLLVVLLRRTARLRAVVRDRRTLLVLTAAAVVISVNWTVYIWGVTHDRVVEASLGYFINPLVTVLMGVVLLGERLRVLQWLAVAIATAAVLVITLGYGRLPWVALVLAVSFACYGLAKKTADVGSLESLAVETTLLAPLAAAYLVVLGVGGAGQLGRHGAGHSLLLLSAGLVTVVPLLCFGAAATELSLVTLGLLQYLTPILQFALGVLWFGEAMPTSRWIGFGLVWVALVLFTTEAIVHRRRQLRLVVAATAA